MTKILDTDLSIFLQMKKRENDNEKSVRPLYVKKILQFASEYVSEKVIDKLEMHYKDELLEYFNSSLGEYYNSLKNALFEYIAHRVLLNGYSSFVHQVINRLFY